MSLINFKEIPNLDYSDTLTNIMLHIDRQNNNITAPKPVTKVTTAQKQRCWDLICGNAMLFYLNDSYLDNYVQQRKFDDEAAPLSTILTRLKRANVGETIATKDDCNSRFDYKYLSGKIRNNLYNACHPDAKYKLTKLETEEDAYIEHMRQAVTEGTINNFYQHATYQRDIKSSNRIHYHVWIFDDQPNVVFIQKRNINADTDNLISYLDRDQLFYGDNGHNRIRPSKHDSEANQLFSSTSIKIYRTKDLPAWLINHIPNRGFRSNSSVMQTLQEFWKIQCADENFSDETVNPSTAKQYHVVKTLIDKLKLNQQSDGIILNANELAEFFIEYQQHHWTQKTAKVQSWLATHDFDNYFSQLVMMDSDYKLRDLYFVKPTDTVLKPIVDQLSLSQNQSLVGAIMLPHQPKSTYNGEHERDVIHGTPNESIIPIINNGLLSHDELEEQNMSHEFTGNSLGNGIYFTDPHNCQRSINFSDTYNDESTHDRYTPVFWAKVKYNNTNTMEDYDSTATENHKFDLVEALDVGTSTFADEIVAPSGEQVTLQALLIIKTHTNED